MAKGYEGNQKVIGPNQKVSLTQAQLDEYIKCANDPVYFIRTYVKIRSVDGGSLIPFDLRDYQVEMIESFHYNRNTICLCPRQAGKTEAVVAYILHFATFNKNMYVAILTNKEKLALDIVGRIRVAYENLPDWLKQSVATYNKGDVEFTNGSRIVASATSIDSARGFPISFLYLDEFAHIDPGMADEFYTSTYPTVSSGKNTKIIISSTPKGMNLFYKLWKDATEKRNSFTPVQVSWFQPPGRNQAWKEKMISDIGEQKFDQEFGCVVGDTLVTIRDNVSGEVQTIPIMDLYMMLECEFLG